MYNATAFEVHVCAKGTFAGDGTFSKEEREGEKEEGEDRRVGEGWWLCKLNGSHFQASRASNEDSLTGAQVDFTLAEREDGLEGD